MFLKVADGKISSAGLSHTVNLSTNKEIVLVQAA
jgi:hypothetical protein